MRTNSTSQVSTPVDLSQYRFVAFCLTYFDQLADQIILPVSMVTSIRSLSALIDAPGNQAILTFNGTTATTIIARVLNQINNGVYAVAYGIK